MNWIEDLEEGPGIGCSSERRYRGTALTSNGSGSHDFVLPGRLDTAGWEQGAKHPFSGLPQFFS
jgi:hypothetical protein